MLKGQIKIFTTLMRRRVYVCSRIEAQVEEGLIVVRKVKGQQLATRINPEVLKSDREQQRTLNFDKNLDRISYVDETRSVVYDGVFNSSKNIYSIEKVTYTFSFGLCITGRVVDGQNIVDLQFEDMMMNPEYNVNLVAQKKQEILQACKSNCLSVLKAKLHIYTLFDRRLVFYKPEDLLVPSVKTASYYMNREKGMDEEFKDWTHPVYSLKHAYILHNNGCVSVGSVFCGMSVSLDETSMKQDASKHLDDE